MKRLIQLSLIEQIKRKHWIVIILATAVLVVLAPQLAPTEINPALATPARVQALYAVIMMICALYFPFASAEQSRAQVTRKQRAFWASAGVTDLQYFIAVYFASVVPILLFTIASSVALGLVGNGYVYWGSAFQSPILTLSATLMAAAIATGLAQFVAASVAGIAGAVINLVGIYGTALVEYSRESPTNTPQQQSFWEQVWTFMPHLNIGEQSERLVFGWKPIEALPFWLAVCYLAGWAGVGIAIGIILFVVKRKVQV